MTHPVTVVCLICTKKTQNLKTYAKTKIIKGNLVNNFSWSISVELKFRSRTKSGGCHRLNSVEMFVLGLTFSWSNSVALFFLTLTFFGQKYLLVELGCIVFLTLTFFGRKYSLVELSRTVFLCSIFIGRKYSIFEIRRNVFSRSNIFRSKIILGRNRSNCFSSV